MQELQAFFFLPSPRECDLFQAWISSLSNQPLCGTSAISLHTAQKVKGVHSRVELRFQVYRESERGREQHVTLSMPIRVEGEWPQTARPGFAFTVA